MSKSDLEYFTKLAKEDVEISKDLPLVLGDNQKTLEVYAKRTALYRKYAGESKNPLVARIIFNQHENILLQAGLISTTHQLQTDIAKLTTRIDALEAKLSNPDR
jgi:hypothetical protein